jgi:hypothetical protein
MTTFTNKPKSSTSFANRDILSGIRVVGDMSEQDFITLLGSAPTFGTMINGVVGGNKTFGELTFEDRIFAPSSLWSLPSRIVSAWSNRAVSS